MITIPQILTSFFLAHGSPMLALEQTDYTNLLSNIGQQYQPKAIIVFTAHWENPVTTISSIEGTYDTIYDFYGFPDALYKVKYPAKGSVEWAKKVQEVLQKNGIKSQFDKRRGLDHGSWTILSKMFPKADIPVVQVSVNPFLSPKDQFEIGKAMRDLNDNVMIIGSGVTVHNLRKLDWNNGPPAKWAVEFDEWLIEKINERDYPALFNYNLLAPNARDAVPRPEHFVPLFISLGTSDPFLEPKVIFKGYEEGSLSYLSFQFA